MPLLPFGMPLAPVQIFNAITSPLFSAAMNCPH
jgi:hypothetical protein